MNEFERVNRNIYGVYWIVEGEVVVYVDHALANYYDFNRTKHIEGKMKETRRMVQNHGRPMIAEFEINECSPLEAEYSQVIYIKMIQDQFDKVKVLNKGVVKQVADDFPANLEKPLSKRNRVITHLFKEGA